MTIALTMLLGFAAWTLFVLMFPIGVHRWSQILTRRAQIHAFPADASMGPDWYRRAMRAHANCIENLPVFGAIVAVATHARIGGPLFDGLAIAVLAARVVQTSVHVGFVQSARVVAVRFGFFSVQLVSMLAMATIVVQRG